MASASSPASVRSPESSSGSALARGWLGGRIRFDRNELSGSFGDIGTDFPLLVGMILAAKLDVASVLTLFGAMQILTGLAYGIPMPAQPLKAMAVLVITQKLSGGMLAGGGLAIGVTMLVLSATGMIDWLARAIPKSVVRGIQFGLGLQLSSLALKDYVPSDGAIGYGLAALAFVVTVALLGNRRLPPAPLLILLGFVYAAVFHLSGARLDGAFGLHLPEFHVPSAGDVMSGAMLLALPQLPLSLGNSILATRQVAADLFPSRPMSVRKIGFTYSFMNLVNPFFGGVPTCHGSGGIAGHYAFGGRTGGSVVLYGSMYLALGLLFAGGFHIAIQLFPKPILGVILLFEALTLMSLVGDMFRSAGDTLVLLVVGLAAFGLPYGYLIGLVVGTALAYFLRSKRAAQESRE